MVELAARLIAVLTLSLRVAPVLAFAPPFTLIRVPVVVRMMLGVALTAWLVAGHPAATWQRPILGDGLIGVLAGELLLGLVFMLILQIAFAAMLQEAGNIRSDFTGGYDGLPGLMFDPLLGHFQYDLYGHTAYWYALAVLAVVFFFVRRIVYSPFGQALTGIRENVRRMHSIGSPVHRRLVTVYAISAGIAGMAGALFTQTNAYVTLTVFDFDASAKVMVMLILGGTGRLYGPFIGAVIYMVMEDYFSKLSPTFWQFGIGLMLVLAVLFARRGLLGLAETGWRKLSQRGAP